MLAWLATCRYAWNLAPVQHQADAWNIAQAMAVLGLLAMLAVPYRDSPAVLAVLALAAAWQVLTAGCSVAYIVAPWPVTDGQEQCDAALDAPVSVVGLWLASLLALQLAQRAPRRDARAK